MLLRLICQLDASDITCINVIALTMNVLLQKFLSYNFSKKTVVNFICLTKDFVVIIVVCLQKLEAFIAEQAVKLNLHVITHC